MGGLTNASHAGSQGHPGNHGSGLKQNSIDKVAKEAERKRRSNLIYGCEDMRSIIFLQKKKEQLEDKKNRQSVVDKESRREKTIKGEGKVKESPERDKHTKPNQRFKDKFLYDPKHPIMRFYDTYMLLVIGFSCFSSAYYCAFDFPTE